jgi:hypothetical protein
VGDRCVAAVEEMLRECATAMRWRVRSDYVYAMAFALLAGISILRLGDPSPFLYYFLF